MRGNLATLLGVLAGALVIIGVLLGALIGTILDVATWNGYDLVGLLYSGIIDFVLGILILIFTGYARSHPPPDKAVGGVVVLVLSGITWFFAGGHGAYVIVVIGAILGVIAGILFILESAFRTPSR
ncbi:MAG: hypothetical protein KGJ23_06825 [Euryarchaeota archaeon]|nr:hypothetical protein [Euryarchaeota archaeon]MDE1836313.1 hypothetical protein [Euryarchaeota archaeon]MDE1879111.1 hypothetical protein [Euryarchaeota archaeon]MDE2044291.1 hypothetical protein [Thermoplasmata archaeon]